MSIWSLLLLLSPLLATIATLGVVMIVALLQARPEDIPALLLACVAALTRLPGLSLTSKEVRTAERGDTDND